MTLVRWDPFRNLNTLGHRFDRFFGDHGGSEGDTAAANWVPSVDIFEDEADVVVRAELPGIDPKGVGLTVTDNILTISGERKFESDEEKENYHRVERLYGTFSRSFTLPRSIDEEKIRADYKDGVLTVRLPKHEKARARQIQIAS
jgi:HSP20 family protein